MITFNKTETKTDIKNCIAICKKEVELKKFIYETKTSHCYSGKFFDELHEETINTLVSIHYRLGHLDLSEEDKEKNDSVYARIREHWEAHKKEKEGKYVSPHNFVGLYECEKLLNTLEEIYNNY